MLAQSIASMVTGEKLAKSDPAALGEHQFVELSNVDSVQDGEVCLVQTAEEVKCSFH